MTQPKLAVWKFASCDGCQLSLLDCEEELLEFSQHIHIANFAEATRAFEPGPYDISLVEGSITTPDDLQRIQDIRQDSQFVITIGACATSGGIQALRNFADVTEFTQAVYAHPEYIKTLETSTPISEHIPVDYELRGCPVNKYQLLEVVKAFVQKRKPEIRNDSVCVECKMSGQVCVLVAHHQPCLGPLTHSGCGALCPSYHRGCYGCFGPKECVNASSLAQWLEHSKRSDKEQLYRLFSTYNSNAPEFKEVHQNMKDSHERPKRN